MRFRMSMSVAAAVAAAGFTVAGCSSASPGGSSAGSTTAATATPATQAASTPAATAPATPAAAAPASAASSQPAQAAGNGGICQTADLGYAVGARSGTSTQVTQAVVLTNNGSAACTLSGFPGVDLVGLANGQQNYTWPLARQSVRYSAVTLQPGGTAHFNLMYLPYAAGGGTEIAVAKMVITPPNDYTQAELAWKQPVLLQDGATHPGTFISPVMPGS